MSLNSYLKKILILPVGLLAACSNSFDKLLFELVPHPQEPIDRLYEVREVEFVNPLDGTRIAGELTYPSEGSNFPAFVLISGHEDGAPPAGRDDEITGHKYFLVISDLLTKRGYAVLRFDNRGVGKSSGDYTVASDDEFASDAAAALAWLRNESGTSISSSGFLGHSQGGSKALIAASQEKPDYIVALGSLGAESLTDTLIRQNRDVYTAKGMSPSKVDQRVRELTGIFEILVTSEGIDEVSNRIREYALKAGVTNEKQIEIIVDNFATNWWLKEARRNSVLLIQSYNNPVLALYGSKDLLVSAAINEAPVRKLLIHPQSEVYTFQGLNHLFQTAKKGTGPDEYWEIEITIEEKVIEKIDNWTKLILNNALQRTSR